MTSKFTVSVLPEEHSVSSKAANMGFSVESTVGERRFANALQCATPMV